MTVEDRVNLVLEHLTHQIQRAILLPLEEEELHLALTAGWCKVSDKVVLHVVVDMRWAPVVKYGVEITPEGRKQLGRAFPPRLIYRKTGT